MIGKREQSRPQCQQMAREVSAVHRRNVERWQRLQRLRVVPVVEVTLVPFQGCHRVECIRRALDELSGRNVAEVVRGQIREQRKPHVGRGRAMRNHGNRMLLIVIRWQPVIFRTDEGLEERPGLARNLLQKNDLVGRQPCFTAGERPADPPGDGGARQARGTKSAPPLPARPALMPPDRPPRQWR